MIECYTIKSAPAVNPKDILKKLEELVTKIRRLGFGRSYDVGASEYYRLEAENWLEQSK